MKKETDPPSDPLPGPVDFSNTEIAFQQLSDRELRRMYRLFKMMSHPWLVALGSKLALLANRLHLPLFATIVKRTIFKQFTGGVSLMECTRTIQKLMQYDTLSILDYGAEGKTEEDDLNHTQEQILRTITFAASSDSVPVVSMKLTGLVDNLLLEKKQKGEAFTEQEMYKWERFRQRFDAICAAAKEYKVGVFVDAEESWIQNPIDEIVLEMMRKYNQNKAVVYTTYQMYRVDALERLKMDYRDITDNGCFFGCKLVRGAYMDKERERAKDMGYPSPIHPDKAATDKAYNDAILFCVDNYEKLASCNASHNLYSNAYQAQLIHERDIVKNHAHLNFSQLYGMADYITFNLAKEGYNVAKYLPYGPVKEVLPYLIRRAEENTSITGELGRELKYIRQEMKRRGLLK